MNLKKTAILISIFILFSCSSTENKDKEVNLWQEMKNKLQIKWGSYFDMAAGTADDSTFWIETENHKCDGTLFNGIYASIGGQADVKLSEDEKNKGKYYRSPQKDCYSNSLKDILPNSQSECSRDMYLGVLLWIVATDRKQEIKDIISWGKQNSATDSVLWTMCAGDKSRTQFRPNLIATAYEIDFRLNGRDNPSRLLPQIWGNCDGFECHLQALHIFIRGLAAGSITDYDLKAIRDLTEKYPENALFWAVRARFDNFVESAKISANILLNQSLFPKDRLPGSEDRCGFYLWQRNPDGNSWKPCEQGRVHSGLDYLFASSILLGII